MARLRLLLALGLMAIGTMFGALALSGYYHPHAPHGRPMVASITSNAGATLLRPRPRQRFVAAETPVVATPPKSKPVAKPAPREAKPKAKDKDKRPQQAAAQWPWNLFGN